jgi:glycerol uptake facilitator-like aquaporin
VLLPPPAAVAKMSVKGYPHWKLEMATTPFRQAVVAEFLATFMFIFSTIGCVV